jgi:hypothetical protein
MKFYKTTPKGLGTIRSLKLHDDSRLSWDLSDQPA